jgi:aminoglycoside phosphotransferase (APT) family kinase protein
VSADPANGELTQARREMLAAALATGLRVPVRVSSLKLAAGGNSRETWVAEACLGAQVRRVVLRCDPDHWIRPVEMAREIRGLELAARAGLPVPKILVSCRTVELERPYVVTEFVEGTAIARQIMREPAYAAARAGFARQCGEILARLHGARQLAQEWSEYDPIAELAWHLGNTDFPSPVLTGAIRWLEHNRVGTAEPASPVHRDFRLGNLMMDTSGIAAVLDWETCQLGDPVEDIAWLCCRSWRYGADFPVGGLGTMSDLLDAYQGITGSVVDPERLHWWTVYAETRWGLAGLARQRDGSAGDVMEQAAIARRACRQEHNVLLELKPCVVRA